MSDGVPDLLADLQRRCAELGIPLTVQRRAACEVLAARSDHPTAEQIFADMAAMLPGISKATAYRTLDKLVQLGLVRRVSHPGGPVRYDAKTYRHHHLVCERCGAVADLESDVLDGIALPDLSRSGFRMRDFSVQFHGLCRSCASPGADRDGPPMRDRRAARDGASTHDHGQRTNQSRRKR